MTKKFGVRPRWTKNEVRLLRKMHAMRSNAEIAIILGRSVQSVVFKASHMGLQKSKKRLREMGKENIAKRWSK